MISQEGGGGGWCSHMVKGVPVPLEDGWKPHPAPTWMYITVSPFLLLFCNNIPQVMLSRMADTAAMCTPLIDVLLSPT